MFKSLRRAMKSSGRTKAFQKRKHRKCYLSLYLTLSLSRSDIRSAADITSSSLSYTYLCSVFTRSTLS
ncbi:hypothetical protein HanRHA438_Chr11g0508461 [Helianthus annuus]|nr:hypothetical protein HanIR_Chr11g0533881 [Helianthus annuus]KAJ0871113.1 hypothetical protein HanRHA438_Chr11g0508461 [Helianthus annuus]